jgi:hypothetical protein
MKEQIEVAHKVATSLLVAGAWLFTATSLARTVVK